MLYFHNKELNSWSVTTEDIREVIIAMAEDLYGNIKLFTYRLFVIDSLCMQTASLRCEGSPIAWK